MVVKFDLSEIPSDAEIIEAIFSLYFIQGDLPTQDTDLCSLFTISREWNVSEVTWINADKDTKWENTDLNTKFFSPGEQDTVISPGGGDYNPECIATTKYTELNKWEHHDVTNAMKEIIKDSDSFYGFLVKQLVYLRTRDLRSSGRVYNSSEAEEVDKRPKLTITYKSTSVVNNFLVNNLNNNILIRKTTEAFKIYVPFENNYRVTIIDLKGKRILSFNGNKKQWFEIPANSITSGMHIICVNTGEETAFKSFLFVQ